MSSNTKIVVLRSKELVYALVLLVVSVLIIMVAVSLFIPSKDSTDEKSAQPSPEVSSEVSSEASQGVSSETPVDVNAGAARYTQQTPMFPVSTQARCSSEAPLWNCRLPLTRTTSIP